MNSDTKGWIIVFLLVVMFFGFWLCLGHNLKGKKDCERNLPRTQECEQVWIPKEGG